MFMQMVDANGRPCAAEKAVAWGSERASPKLLISSIASLLTWHPMRLPLAEARRVVANTYGPRHVVPELSRVQAMPEPARNEVGRWKGRLAGGKGRMSSLANRYSRSGERTLQISLRSYTMLQCRERYRTVGYAELQRVPLDFFVVSPLEMPGASPASNATTDVSAAAE